MYRAQPAAGGVDPHPVITSYSANRTNSILQWYGLLGNYHVQRATSLAPTNWVKLRDQTAYSHASSLTVTNPPGVQCFYRLNKDYSYAGASVCGGCHADIYGTWQGTGHATAYDAVASMPPALGCAKCHTVGSGLPGGFVDTNTTPELRDVRCENCHGPAGQHAFGDHYVNRPVVTYASEVCGGCHTGPQQPTFDEWAQSPHAAVTPELVTMFTNAASGLARQMACGPCHSGATRLAMVRNLADMLIGYTNALVLPTSHDAAGYGQTCVVCHDPHATNGNPAQLRYPVTSTNFYSFTPGAASVVTIYTNWDGTIITNVAYYNTVFANQHNTSVQVCAQCHNARGAQWTDTSFPPHHSAQHNLMLGNIGELGTGTAPYQPSTHALFFTNQCVSCHMQSQPYQNDAMPATTGHKFTVDAFELCIQCHGPYASNLVQFAQESFRPALAQQVKIALDLWATTKAPAALRNKYGTRAWEYTNPGGLSSGGSGPTASEQALIPDNIKKARFNLYLFYNDRASGIHNPLYVSTLTEAAISWVQLELGQ